LAPFVDFPHWILILLMLLQECSYCKTKQKSTKRLYIQKFPRILIIRYLFDKCCINNKLYWLLFEAYLYFPLCFLFRHSNFEVYSIRYRLYHTSWCMFISLWISDLKRFAHDSFRTKLSTKVKCPVRGLDLEKFAAEKCKYTWQQHADNTRHVTFRVV